MSRKYQYVFAVVACLLIGQFGVSALVAAQAGSQSLSLDSDPEKAVPALLDKILKRGETSEGTIRMSRWVGPTAEDVTAIKRFGKSAILPLDAAFTVNRSFQQLLVVRLLSEIGGPEIVPTIKRALSPTLPNSVRVAALAALTTVPDDQALPLIKANINDHDPLVSQRAKDLLADHYHVTVDQ